MSNPTRYLLFTLAAPIASFGTIAVGERRPTADRPAKSAIIGMIACALGIERTQEDKLRDLTASLGYAVRVEDAGLLASDYHTTQVPPARRNRRFATRAEELAVPKHELKTILSAREFRTGVLATICVWLKAPGPKTLDEMEAALKSPTFVLFAGRKAHPLMLPCRPTALDAADLRAAFTAYDASEPEAIRNLKSAFNIRPRPQALQTIYADADEVGHNQAQRIDQRRDIPESRAKWRFGLRSEAVLRRLGQGAGRSTGQACGRMTLPGHVAGGVARPLRLAGGTAGRTGRNG